MKKNLIKKLNKNKNPAGCDSRVEVKDLFKNLIIYIISDNCKIFKYNLIYRILAGGSNG